MSEDRIQQRLEAYLREQADQPFGDAELRSGRTLQPFSRAAMDAAENLLVKAARALASGDLERMDHFVGLAARLNYDPHEETDPAAYAVHMMLFDAVVDALEESEHGDARWLDAAVEVMGSVDGWGQSEMRHSLLTARQDYQVDRQEHRAIEAAVADVPERSELYDVRLPHDELKEAVVSVLVTLQAYRAALESRSG